MRSSKLSKPRRNGAENTEIRDIHAVLVASNVGTRPLKSGIGRLLEIGVAMSRHSTHGSAGMSRTVAVVTPAFRAEATIVATVQSLLAQSWTDWELWLVADDGADYEAFLNERGIADERIRFVASGGTGRGASLARNVALARITAPFLGILDADDRMKPDKLARVVGALAEYPVVTTALEVMTEDFQHLRYVGHGPDRELTPGSHKWVSLSMDSMVAWDRRRTDEIGRASCRERAEISEVAGAVEKKAARIGGPNQ